jgi:DNA-binding transcriptional ArsR family regulator
VESVFDIIAEPNRRAILSLLVSSQQPVGETERRLRMPQPTVSKRLRVLREAVRGIRRGKEDKEKIDERSRA